LSDSAIDESLASDRASIKIARPARQDEITQTRFFFASPSPPVEILKLLKGRSVGAMEDRLQSEGHRGPYVRYRLQCMRRVMVNRGENWRELCKEAATEYDPEKLMSLISRIIEDFDESSGMRFVSGANVPPADETR